MGVLLTTSAAAQQRASVGLYAPNPRVQISFVSEQDARRVHLAAMVVWRGQPDWFTTSGENARAAVRDSTARRRAARQGRHPAAGICIPARCAWTEFDPDRRSVHLLGRSFRLPARDSTLVLLVDGADRPTPAIRSFVIRTSPRAPVEARTSAETLRELKAEQDHFLDIAKEDARIREFVRDWERLPARTR